RGERIAAPGSQVLLRRVARQVLYRQHRDRGKGGGWLILRSRSLHHDGVPGYPPAVEREVGQAHSRDRYEDRRTKEDDRPRPGLGVSGEPGEQRFYGADACLTVKGQRPGERRNLSPRQPLKRRHLGTRFPSLERGKFPEGAL